MENLKYKVIKNSEQYYKYCDLLESLTASDSRVAEVEIELLSVLIEKWDEEQNTFDDLDPIGLLKSLMEENNLKAKDLAEILDLSKATVSKMLNYRKGLSKSTIRKLSDYFKLSQEAFNQSYKLLEYRGNLKKIEVVPDVEESINV
ncbi:MAG: helix-turn-helix domain-containing protein [Saprospirales bacterium]|nr:MAG: helix-turn-helix domain-containing protein [Saprospirales bacterium]